MMTLQSLRFSVCQCFCSLFKVINDGLQFGIPVFYDDSSIEALPFNNSTCSAYSKSLWRSAFLEPVKKQTITVSLTTITIVTQIEQNVKVLLKENIKDGKNGLLHFGVMGRFPVFYLLYYKLISITSSYGCFLFKGNRITNSKFCLKPEFTIGGNLNGITRSLVYKLCREVYHNDTIVPVSPSLRHCSSMRFSAARLIASERLKRANASS